MSSPQSCLKLVIWPDIQTNKQNKKKKKRKKKKEKEKKKGWKRGEDTLKT